VTWAIVVIFRRHIVIEDTAVCMKFRSENGWAKDPAEGHRRLRKKISRKCARSLEGESTLITRGSSKFQLLHNKNSRVPILVAPRTGACLVFKA